MNITNGSVFKDMTGIEYFNFEEDFVEKNIRCIPMIVRFKMDKAGIKLKLAEWSIFSVEERIQLAMMPCNIKGDAKLYHDFLAGLIKHYTDKEATILAIDQYPLWIEGNDVPGILLERLQSFNWDIPGQQWSELTNLQRFALLKLCKPGHESKNFPRAMKEFGLT